MEHKAYMKEYYERNKDRMKLISTSARKAHSARHNRRLRGIYRIRKVQYSNILKDERGGHCAVCGYNKNYAALVWHHLDADNKLLALADTIKATGKIAEDKIRAETSKCILLCTNCHQELHNPQQKREV